LTHYERPCCSLCLPAYRPQQLGDLDVQRASNSLKGFKSDFSLANFQFADMSLAQIGMGCPIDLPPTLSSANMAT